MVTQVALGHCAGTAIAQFSLPHHDDISSSHRSLYLSMGLGVGRALYRDQGTSPLSYPGITLLPDMGLLGERPRYRWQLMCRSAVGLYHDALASRFAMDAIGVGNQLQGRVLRKWQPASCHTLLLYGIGLGNQLYIRYNLHHQNASVGVSNFTYISLHGAIEQPLGRKGNRSSSWTLLAEANLFPFAGVLRPGYAFIDNYTGANDLYATFGNQYQYYLCAFSGIATEIGLRKEWPSGHRMTISYQWQYIDSGICNGWRYENASHNLCCRFDLQLHQRHATK